MLRSALFFVCLKGVAVIFSPNTHDIPDLIIVHNSMFVNLQDVTQEWHSGSVIFHLGSGRLVNHSRALEPFDMTWFHNTEDIQDIVFHGKLERTADQPEGSGGKRRI